MFELFFTDKKDENTVGYLNDQAKIDYSYMRYFHEYKEKIYILKVRINFDEEKLEGLVLGFANPKCPAERYITKLHFHSDSLKEIKEEFIKLVEDNADYCSSYKEPKSKFKEWQ